MCSPGMLLGLAARCSGGFSYVALLLLVKTQFRLSQLLINLRICLPAQMWRYRGRERNAFPSRWQLTGKQVTQICVVQNVEVSTCTPCAEKSRSPWDEKKKKSVHHLFHGKSIRCQRPVADLPAIRSGSEAEPGSLISSQSRNE